MTTTIKMTAIATTVALAQALSGAANAGSVTQMVSGSEADKIMQAMPGSGSSKQVGSLKCDRGAGMLDKTVCTLNVSEANKNNGRNGTANEIMQALNAPLTRIYLGAGRSGKYLQKVGPLKCTHQVPLVPSRSPKTICEFVVK